MNKHEPIQGHIYAELMRRGWALDVGGQTTADRSARRSPPMTLYTVQHWREATVGIRAMWARHDRVQSQLHAPGYDPYNHQLGHTLPRGDWNTMHAHVHVGVDMAKPGADHTVHWWG